MSVPSYPFHSLPLKLSNKGMSFPFSPLKLSNKGREEYSKIILFIPFHSIPFPPPKRGLRESQRKKEREVSLAKWNTLREGASKQLSREAWRLRLLRQRQGDERSADLHPPTRVSDERWWRKGASEQQRRSRLGRSPTSELWPIRSLTSELWLIRSPSISLRLKRHCSEGLSLGLL